MWRRIVAASLSMALAGCAFPPPLGSHLPHTFAEADPAFDARVRARFPIGTEEAVVVRELVRERFKITAVHAPPINNPDGFTAEADHGGNMGIACELKWTVIWRADQGRISAIEGHYGATCL